MTHPVQLPRWLNLGWIQLVNDDAFYPATVQLVHMEDEFSIPGATVLLRERDSLSLVLNAGSKYHYILKQRGRETRMS